MKKNVPPSVWKNWIATELQAANRRFEKLKKKGTQFKVPDSSRSNKSMNKNMHKNMHIIEEEEDSEHDSRRQSSNLDY